MAKLSTIKLPILRFSGRSQASATRHEEAEIHQDLGNNKKNASLTVENSVGFQIHIESHARINQSG